MALTSNGGEGRSEREGRTDARHTPIDVLHITSEFPPLHFGGLGVSLAGLAKSAERSGSDVSILLVDSDGSGYESPAGVGQRYGYPDESSRERARFLDAKSSKYTLVDVAHEQAVYAGVQLVHDRQPAVIHLHSSWLWPIASELRNQTRLPIIYTLHSIDKAEVEAGEWIPHGDLQDTAIAGADMLIALSQGDRDNLLRHYPDAGPFRVIGNGIDCDADDGDLHSCRSTDRPVRVLYVGRFAHRKGLDELLLAVPILLERHPSIEFLFVGGGSRGESSTAASSWLPPNLRGDKRVRFAGWERDVQRYYGISDILVVPSRYEPFGLVVLEGMRSGIAIAATTTAGPSEILRDEVSALLFSPRDVDDLARTVSRLIEDLRLRRRLGDAAAREVRRHWSWSTIYDHIEQAYLDLLIADRLR